MKAHLCTAAGVGLLAALSIPAMASAQEADLKATIVTEPAAKPADAKGPDVRGVITGHSADKLQVTTADGTRTIVALTDTTRVRSIQGPLGIGRTSLAATALLNGLPVSIKTLQSGDALLAEQVNFRKSDLKTATMIKGGTAQGFEEQTAATTALRGRMGDIDQYNVKNTVNVNFDTGKAVLSEHAKADLCATASTAEGIKNALLLIVGYTDSTGNPDFNQRLSEKRASRVVNYIQQACGWKPYRMLTPAGMAQADPVASNDSDDGKAQNRRVAVNVLVSKGLDGL
jgi:OmpA-OmpF porin, OOP family